MQKLFEHCRIGVWQSLAALGILLALVAVRAPLRQVPGALFVSDGFGYYSFLPSLVIDGDLDFSNQFQRLPYEGSKRYFRVVPETGRHANPFPVGTAILWAPAFLVAHATVTLGLEVGLDATNPGFGYAYELPTYVVAFLYGLAGALLVERLITSLFSRRVAAWTIFMVLVCTPYGYYLFVEPNMSHVTSACAVTVFVSLLWRTMERRDLRVMSWAWLGAVLGIVASIRPTNAVVGIAALPALSFVQQRAVGGRTADLARIAAFAMAAVLAFLPQLVTSWVLFGSPVAAPPGSGYDQMSWFRPHILRAATSTLSFFPLIAVAAIGLVTRRRLEDFPNMCKRRETLAHDVFFRRILPALAVGLIAVAYFIACIGPAGSLFGESFGQRRLVDWTVVLAIGFASGVSALPQAWQRHVPRVLIFVGCIEVTVTMLYMLKLLPEWGGVGHG